jgi:hypothetical protein
MSADYDWLRTTNEEIGHKEEEGDRPYFEDLLAAEFAFMRRDGSLVGREAYLQAVQPSAPRKTIVESVTLIGAARACVTAIVRVGDECFHNVRIFVRQQTDWKLLAWANEQISFP